MKRFAFSISFCLLAGISTSAEARADPCAAIICLAGKLAGESGGSKCNGPISDYFSIKKTKKGKFDPGRTASARMDYLNSCPDNSLGKAQQINSAFGRLKSGF